MTPLDIENLVQPRVERSEGEYDYSTHGSFIDKCDSYSEYLLKCCIEGIEPLVTAAEFDNIKTDNFITDFLNSNAVLVNLATFPY